ncbi:MAG: adenylyltransferase/cytidyltransferase family protein [Candidatus Nanohaloarchaea archaeon]
MTTAFIGRFQPFHKGHKHVIDRYRDEKELLIVIADEESRTEENPLSFEERKDVLSRCSDLEIFTQVNHPGEDRKWTEEIIEKTGAEAVISQNERTIEAIENHSDLEIIRQEMKQSDLYSGTEVRRRIRSGEEWRYLVPDCAEKRIAELEEVIKKTGIQYEFEPGWKKENAYHDTADK